MSPASFRAVHVGDLHFWSFAAGPRSLAGKRVLGLGNLAWKRSRSFRQREAPALADRLLEVAPDYALFSGDFSTTSLRAEFSTARRIFEPLSEQTGRRLWCVPGNHDRYTARELLPGGGHFDRELGDWRPGRRSFEKGRRPWIRSLGDGVAAIGIDPTTSNGFGSHGLIRPGFVKALRAWWERYGDRVRELWLLCHFPAEEPPGLVPHDRGEQLRKASLLLDWIHEIDRPVFFLHGHHHHRWIFSSLTVPGLVYLNAGAPLLRRGRETDLGFHELTRAGGETALAMHWRRASGDWRRRPVEIPAPGVAVDLQFPDA